jgi:hypothetical protein
VTLFSAHGDVVVGFAIFHIVLFQKEKNGKKKIKKWHSSMVCESWWAPTKLVSHGLWKEKGGEECQAL